MRLPAGVLERWEQYLRAEWRASSEEDRREILGLLGDYAEHGSEDERADAEAACRLLDGDDA